MPDPVTDRLYVVLTTDAALSGLLAQYNGVPAVFTTDPAPEDSPFPYILMRGNSQNSRADSLNTQMRVVSRDILVFAKAEGDPSPVDTIAWRIRDMFDDAHGSALGQMDRWYPITLDADGPIESNPDPDTYGRSVDLTITMERF